MSERQLTIVLFIALGVILVGGGLGLYYMRFVWLDELNQEYDKVAKEVEIAEQKQRDIPKLIKQKAELDEQIAAIIRRIPEFNKFENDAYADKLDSIRKKTRVMMADMKLKPGRAGPGPDALPPGILRAKYEFKASGGFFQLVNFLNHIETDLRLLFADNIKISAGASSESRGGGIPPRELVITVSTFLKKVVAPAAPTVKPGVPPEKEEPKEEEVKRLSTPPPD